MPYLTPDEIPEERDCRALSIPASTDWLAIVSGALTELTKTYNWEQQGSVTVDEAVAAMQTMIDAYYEGCASGTCMLPGGYHATRINAAGHLEILNDSGEWVDATGDYTYPAITPREGGTEQDQICLAAANCANVFELAYEQITEAYAGEISEAEALSALIEWFIITVGGEAAPFAFAIAMFLLPIFVLAYSALNYLTADLWTDQFTQQFVCLLVNCATNTDGVITFDWDCVEHALYATTYSAGLSEVQLRLYMQINFIIWSLGGVDALNAAGATTAITEYDCGGCSGCEDYAELWVSELDERTTLGESVHLPAGVETAHGGAYAAYVAGSVYGHSANNGYVIATVNGTGVKCVNVVIDLQRTCFVGTWGVWMYDPVASHPAYVSFFDELGAELSRYDFTSNGVGWQHRTGTNEANVRYVCIQMITGSTGTAAFSNVELDV